LELRLEECGLFIEAKTTEAFPLRRHSNIATDKGKIVPLHGLKVYKGMGNLAQCSLKVDARWMFQQRSSRPGKEALGIH
jgi:hypothetical protein